MSIRTANGDDVIIIAQMLRRFYSSHSPYGIRYDHASCLQTVLDTIARGVCLVGQKSCAGALLCPFPYNHEAIVAQVVFWYIEHRREISIFDVLVCRCREAGATHINVATVAPKHVGKRFYEVRGLKLAEAQYMGPLDLACKRGEKS